MRNKIFFLLTFSTIFNFIFSQEKVQLNNQDFYVYPHKKDATPSWIFIQAVNKKEKNNKLILFKKLMPEMAINEEDFDANYEYFENEYLFNFGTKTNPKALAYIRQNSRNYYETNYNLHQTVTPSLDKIADGKYIQYFEDLIELDVKGNIRLLENQVAGHFEIRNNLIEGFAYWLNPRGDTIEQGNFKNGKRIGKWKFLAYNNFSTNLTTLKADPVYSVVNCEYVEGIIEGPYTEFIDGKLIFEGNYTNGNPTGEWKNYSHEFIFDEKLKVDNEFYYLKNHYTALDVDQKNLKKVHKQLIRNTSFMDVMPLDSFNLPQNAISVRIEFNKLYRFHAEEIEDLELPEEKLFSYEGENYDEFDYSDSSIFINYDGNAWINNKTVSKGKLIDSLGIEFLYDGVYEEFHPNGQLKFRYIFKDGNLLSEDTIFWDNGKAANVILFDEKSKTYSQTTFDYDGKLMVQNSYDSIGQFIKKTIDKTNQSDLMIDGYLAKYYDQFNFYEYECYDTLRKPINEKLSFYRSWYGNKKPLANITFDPKSREAQININSLNQNKKNEVIYSFGEDYKFFSSKSISKYKNLTSKITSNGSYTLNNPKDTIPHSKIFNLNGSYEVNDDHELLLDEQLYSGTFVLNNGKKKFSSKIKTNSISLNLGNDKFKKKLKTDIKKYLKTGKAKYNDLFSFIEGSENYEKNVIEIFPMIMDLDPNFIYGDYTYYEDEIMTADKNQPITEKIEGKFENGKAVGKWYAYDQFGKVRIEMDYANGEKNGTIKYFNYAFPKPKTPQFDYEMEYEDPMMEYPAQKTYFLEHEVNYKNGVLNGIEKFYDWQGNVTFSGFYKDGFLDGESKEINRLITSTSVYEEGLLDGISTVKLSLPEKDTIVLYELNFQNHQLQGESKSYHPNGNIAKRGFFLNGEPIEDFEAYDSLGTKYHYVKFLYSYPVEEKIWEENELSVRYLFDWQDSIFFRPDDLVNIPSAYDLFYQYGLISGEEFEQPYYGRPSIVDKAGIQYQITKYYPDQKVARDGTIKNGKKIACWTYYSYDGVKLYEIDYFDTILKINDSIKFKSKGIRSDFDQNGNLTFKSYVIEKIENYDCSHTDHYEVRQFYTIWEANDSIKRSNSYVKNYYDNGTLQSEGNMLNGLPTGIWKYYTPNGMLNQVGEYVQGKRHGRWLKGDLSKTKYLGDICMNPNLPDLEKRIEYQENLLDIEIRYFKLGKIQNSEFYGINMNLKK
jgi:antitoxin component YwqK of YwqJK toxin-antitoxin module